MDWWAVIVAIILGIVEGLTEFAPVSSTGHMIIVDDLWLKSKELFSPDVANTFKIVVQLGSILAVVVVFWDRLWSLIGIERKGVKKQNEGQSLRLPMVIVGLIPATVLGFLFEDFIDEHLFSIETVLIGLIGGSFLMIAADLLHMNKKRVTHTVDQLSYKQALIMGLFQCIALWPGFSRSGSTISGGVIAGISHRASADFTFIMAVPIMMGASGLSLYKNWEYMTPEALPFFIAGFISAFLFALISIRFFLALISKVQLVPFAIYRIILGVILMIIVYA
ncbi:undecaprenyl-diphosphate phosphatase [Jeotgalibacillus sp. S-D1]|uniref:undecaprenyl-diphosphate phosphatase n=1 Tax=Jeotgalibacillus sp. S-D1 TaxID=2552189 RepID=UPI001059BE23|nr:undecaprenyl-diphosphate phosphatase [Jeotgalibacillus sp. S-D1]TDL35427.1 undecaprenyl-diphosphate phosphatase [Jeotgalibacillus sp. S-D1]